MSTSITKINFSCENHKEIIMKLCARNNFYKNDMYIEINRDYPPFMKEWFIEMRGIAGYNMYIENLFLGLESFGYFVTLEENSKKKVVGFVIYNIEEKMKKSYLLFILIDKKYQKNGFGQLLLEKYIKDIEEKKLLYATVKIENEIVGNFYRKFGFDNHYDIIIPENGKYELLHYIPNYSLLNRIKKIISDKSQEANYFNNNFLNI